MNETGSATIYLKAGKVRGCPRREHSKIRVGVAYQDRIKTRLRVMARVVEIESRSKRIEKTGFIEACKRHIHGPSPACSCCVVVLR